MCRICLIFFPPSSLLSFFFSFWHLHAIVISRLRYINGPSLGWPGVRVRRDRCHCCSSNFPEIQTQEWASGIPSTPGSPHGGFPFYKSCSLASCFAFFLIPKNKESMIVFLHITMWSRIYFCVLGWHDGRRASLHVQLLSGHEKPLKKKKALNDSQASSEPPPPLSIIMNTYGIYSNFTLFVQFLNWNLSLIIHLELTKALILGGL